MSALKQYINDRVTTSDPNPSNLKVLYWAIDQLGYDWGSTHTASLPGMLSISAPDQCNYFVGSAYAYGAGATHWPTGWRALSHWFKPYAADANTLASRGGVEHTKIVGLPEPGDIVSFHKPGNDSGHTSLFLGGNLIIYAGGFGIGKIGTVEDNSADHDGIVNRKYVP